jgi:60 kDa SS-A/Ro ribonucleoprotein
MALDASLVNIPEISGKIVVCPDMSGSMNAAVTGNRDSEATGQTARRGAPQGATSTVRCRDVASLVSAAVLRKMPSTTTVLPFSDHVDIIALNPLDALATNTMKLAALPSGGTNCSLPLAHLIANGIKADVVIYLSDNESWINSQGLSHHVTGYGVGQHQPSSGLMDQWTAFKRQNPKAKLVCVDLAPNPTAQVIEREDIMSIGGWSDTCFSIIADFVKNGNSGEIWIDRIEAVPLYEGVRPSSQPVETPDENIEP